MENPFAVAQNAIDAPVDEHAEFHVLKFVARLQVFGSGLVVGLSEEVVRGKHRAGCNGNNSSAICDPGLSNHFHLCFFPP